MTVNKAPREQAKSASNVSRRTLTSGCGLIGALFILAAVLGWNMICNIVAAVVVINLSFSLYYGYKAEKLLKIKEGG